MRSYTAGAAINLEDIMAAEEERAVKTKKYIKNWIIWWKLIGFDVIMKVSNLMNYWIIKK